MADHSWDEIKLGLSVSTVVAVRVIEQKAIRAFVELDCGVQGIIERIGLSKQGFSIEQFPIGSMFDAEVLGSATGVSK